MLSTTAVEWRDQKSQVANRRPNGSGKQVEELF